MPLPWDLASPAGSPACHPPTDYPPATDLLSGTKVHIMSFPPWLLSFKPMLPGYPALPIHRVSPVDRELLPTGALLLSDPWLPSLTSLSPCGQLCLAVGHAWALSSAPITPSIRQTRLHQHPRDQDAGPSMQTKCSCRSRLTTMGDVQPHTAAQHGITDQIKTQPVKPGSKSTFLAK